MTVQLLWSCRCRHNVTNVQSGGNVIPRDKSYSYNLLIPRDPNLMLKLEAALEQPKSWSTDLINIKPPQRKSCLLLISLNTGRFQPKLPRHDKIMVPGKRFAKGVPKEIQLKSIIRSKGTRGQVAKLFVCLFYLFVCSQVGMFVWYYLTKLELN